MEPVTQSIDDSDIRAQLAKAKFDDKWDILKPVINKLWKEGNRKLSELIEDVKNTYGFTAQLVIHYLSLTIC